ncbi:MAG: peptide ABC transporter substrate-binding protein, partial [Chloroflexota bacterium]
LFGCGNTPEITNETSIAPEAAPTEEIPRAGNGDTLNLLLWQAPTILNPHLATGTKDIEAGRIVYEPLATYNAQGELIPFLATEIPAPAPDGLSVTWQLKQGVQWADGEPFTADDVLFTYEYVTNPDVNSASANVYTGIESVEVIDDHTVKINFPEVNPAWSIPFVGVRGVILPRHIFADYNGTNAREAPANTLPIGTGPYQVLEPGIEPQEILFLGTELVQTNKIAFEANPVYREDPNQLFSQIVLRGGGTVDEAARLVFQTKDVDYATQLQVTGEQLAILEVNATGQLVSNFGRLVERIILNRSNPHQAAAGGELSNKDIPHPFFTDLKVRQAFSLAINRDAIVEGYGPIGRPTTNLLVSPANFASPNTTREFDLTKAASLLDEAGWVDNDGDCIRDKDGVKMEVVFQTSSNTIRQNNQRIVKDALESIGVKVDIKILPASSFFSGDPTNPDTLERFEADIEEYRTGNRSPDPGAYMKFWTCDQIPQQANNWSGQNVARWCNPEYDALYQQSTIELDPVKRQELFIQMNDLVVNDIVIIPLVHQANVSGASKTIEGIDLSPWDGEFWNIKDWRRVSP